MTPLSTQSRVWLIDASGYLFRAYHALPPLSRSTDGLPVGAVSGYSNMLWKLIRDLKDSERPTHLACIFDSARVSFRTEIYPAYKANRPEPPEDLRPQFPLVRDASRAFGVPAVELPGFEADDLIATYARLATQAGARTTIVSSDKDLMQLINDQVSLYDPMKNKPLGREACLEKFGVTPDKVVDVQALMGDSVDNVPGAPGIGPKTAAELIGMFGDLESVLARAGEIKQPKRREAIENHAEQIRISRRLVELDANVPVPVPLEALGVAEPDPQALLAFLDGLELRALSRRVRDSFHITHAPVAAPLGDASAQGQASPSDAHPAPGGMQIRLQDPVWTSPLDHARFATITTLDALRQWVARAHETGLLAVDTETRGLGPRAPMVGISLAVGANEACYIPLRHTEPLMGAPLDGQLGVAEVIAELKGVLSDPAVLKIGHNIKYDLNVFAHEGAVLSPIADTMLMSYALGAGLHNHSMDDLSERLLGTRPIPFSEVCGSGKTQITFDRVPIDRASAYAAEDAAITLRLYHVLEPRLAAEGVRTVYETLERGLPPVVAAMEREGILVDPNMLSRLSGDFAQRMAGLEAQAHELAGKPFNVGSPKQLGDILFGDMKLPGGTKTKTGAWSTDADVLDDLAAAGHALPRTLLEWRQLSKLRSTYTEALREAIDPHTRRVHTSFSLAATSTGRFASTDPNLQNIPVRSDEGRRIREAFIAEPGHVLISADYSQIELRLLAHIADIPELKKAFADGLDIHAMTASEMFGVPIEGMDPMVRRQAKAINFGIIYGISAFGLARNLGIGQSEASAYIKTYFARFPGIREYMERTKEFAREHGFVRTAFGRKCWVPQIRSKTPAERAFGERQSINSPIQGSAADVIRRAMIAMPGALAQAGLRARMLLQVHDELIFEAPVEEADATCALVSRVMERAPLPALHLNVPLVVDARAAANWAKAH